MISLDLTKALRNGELILRKKERSLLRMWIVNCKNIVEDEHLVIHLPKLFNVRYFVVSIISKTRIIKGSVRGVLDHYIGLHKISYEALDV